MSVGLVIALNITLWIFALVWLRRLIVRRLRPERILSDLQNEVNELVREIGSVGDRHTTVVEDRITTLKAMLARAERLIEDGEMLLRRLESHTGVPEAEEAPVEDRESEAFDLRRAVERLHRQGVAAAIIANRLGVAIGEVELMIALSEQKIR